MKAVRGLSPSPSMTHTLHRPSRSVAFTKHPQTCKSRTRRHAAPYPATPCSRLAPGSRASSTEGTPSAPAGPAAPAVAAPSSSSGGDTSLFDMLARLERSTQLRPRRQQEEQQEQLQQAVDADQDAQQAPSHGPGFCACCRPLGAGEPVTQVITYVDGVVLEVETADGDVVFLDEEDDADRVSYSPYASDTQNTAPAGGASGASLVYVPDMVIPPPAPPLGD